MRPIEQVHRQILAGNVLGPSGTWIPRSEALKRKRVQLKHILDGEIEIEGSWVKLSSVETKKKLTPFLASEQPFRKTDQLSALKKQMAQTEVSPPKRIPPVHNNSAANDQTTIVPPQPPLQRNPANPPASLEQEQSHEPDQTTEEQSSTSKQTITIRTLPLGKETILTISESRAGDALVAICSIQGYIDQTNSDELNAQIMSMLDFGVKFFIIDFEHTNLIGSAGWGVLAVASRLIKAAQGHLLICAMSEEIEESFLLLQFNEVIDSRKTISDCLDAIDTFLAKQKSIIETAPHEAKESFHIFGDSFEDLPIHEKVKSIISHNGPIGIFAIKKLLESQRYGSVRINALKLFILLKELNLESKWKRVRFYRSC